MALNPNELVSSASGPSEGRTVAHRVRPKEFASGSGTLAKNAPVAFNTSTLKWVPWVSGGANGAGTIKGFVWPDAIVLDADEEVLGHVMLEGLIHSDDVKAATSESDSNVEAMLRADCRALGIHVEGLTQVR